VKLLIGTIPQGSIAFISKGWRGRVSDVYISLKIVASYATFFPEI